LRINLPPIGRFSSPSSSHLPLRACGGRLNRVVCRLDRRARWSRGAISRLRRSLDNIFSSRQCPPRPLGGVHLLSLSSLRSVGFPSDLIRISRPSCAVQRYAASSHHHRHFCISHLHSPSLRRIPPPSFTLCLPPLVIVESRLLTSHSNLAVFARRHLSRLFPSMPSSLPCPTPMNPFRLSNLFVFVLSASLVSLHHEILRAAGFLSSPFVATIVK
jgi:hypothetical protein